MVLPAMTSESFPSPQELRQRRALRISAHDVPALFSEGPEPETRECKTWWPHVEPRQFKAIWPALFERLNARTKAALQT
jgi:hypothetical protein